MPPHTSHLTQPADVAVFGPLATFHGQETDRLTCNGVRRISKAEWVEIYTIAREKAFTSKNIEAAWRGAGLVPLDRSKVLRHIPAAAMPPNTPHKPLQQAPLIFGSSPPDRELLREQNATFNQKVSAVQLSVRTQKYARDLTAATEQLAAQVRILRRSNETKEEILSNRVERKSGKRKALKGHFLVSTVELRDAVFAAEEETAKKKAAKRPPKRKAPTKQPPRAAKRKRPATPSESSEESSEEYSSEESDISECIALE